MNALNTLTQAPWAEALGWTLLHSLWQGVLISAVLALYWQLSRRRPARYRYLASVAATWLLLAWAGYTLAQQWQAARHTPPLAPAIADAPSLGLAPTPVPPLALPATWQQTAAATLDGLTPWLTAAWLLGLALFLMRWMVGYFWVQELRYRDANPMDYRWQHRLNDLGQAMGLRRTVLLIESARIDSPLTLGHFKPVVLVPLGLLSGLSAAQVEAVLIHELAHIRRHDYLINLMVSLLEVVFFYHPAMWWLGARVREAREYSCDDLAIAQGSHPLTYARTLSLLAERSGSEPTLAPGMGGPRKALLARIRRLVAPQQQAPSHPGKVLLATVLFMSLSTLAWLTPERQAQMGQAMERLVLEGPIGTEMPWLAAGLHSKNPAPAPAPAPCQACPEDQTLPPPPPLPSPPAEWTTLAPVDTPPPSPPQMAPLPPMPPMPELPAVAPEASADPADWEAYATAMEQWGEQWAQLQEQYQQEYAQAMEQYAREMEQWAEAEAENQVQGDRYGNGQRETETEVRGYARPLRSSQAELERARAELERAQEQLEKAKREELSLEEIRRREEALLIQEVKMTQLEHNAETLRRHEEARQRGEQARQRAMERHQREMERHQRAMEEMQREQEARQRALEAEQRERERAREQRWKEFDAGMETLRREMRADGLLDPNDEHVALRSKNGALRLNGQKITGDQLEKYRELLEGIGIEIGEGVSISISTD